MQAGKQQRANFELPSGDIDDDDDWWKQQKSISAERNDKTTCEKNWRNSNKFN